MSSKFRFLIKNEAKDWTNQLQLFYLVNDKMKIISVQKTAICIEAGATKVCLYFAFESLKVWVVCDRILQKRNKKKKEITNKKYQEMFSD